MNNLRLLIVTQKVDREDPILGFFHEWIEGFATRTAKLTVIGQAIGDYELPSVNVLSLGKENGKSKTYQVFRFWYLLWKERGNYDAVFVHMTPIWVVIGAPLWKLLGKRIYLWYEARGKTWKLRLAIFFVNKVFSASVSGMPLSTKKSIITGHGIDCGKFCNGTEHHEEWIATVGRITPSKRIEYILLTIGSLPTQYHLIIAGQTMRPGDDWYLLDLLTKSSHLLNRIILCPFPQEEIPKLLKKTNVFLHASETGLDKALLEAMSCGCLVVSCSESAKRILPQECIASPETMPYVTKALLSLSPEKKEILRRELREIVVKNHSLPDLMDRLSSEMHE